MTRSRITLNCTKIINVERANISMQKKEGEQKKLQGQKQLQKRRLWRELKLKPEKRRD